MNTPMNKMANAIIANIMYKRMNLLMEIAFKSSLIAEKLKVSDKESWFASLKIGIVKHMPNIISRITLFENNVIVLKIAGITNSTNNAAILKKSDEILNGYLKDSGIISPISI